MNTPAIAEAPRWLLLAILALAPWAYGSLTSAPRTTLTTALLLMAVCRLGAIDFRRPLTKSSRLPTLLALTLFSLGWFMTLNARAQLDWLWHRFEPSSQIFAFLPGTWDAATSATTMLLVTGYLAAFIVSLDFAGDPVWRRRLQLVLATSGTSLIALGLIQRLTGADSIYWQYGVSDSLYYPTFFATLYDDGNAGSFINLTLPFLLAPLLVESSNKFRPVWIVAVLIALAGAVANTSRSSQAITALIVLTFLATLAYRRRFTRPTLVLAGLFAGATALLFLILLTTGHEETWTRTFRSIADQHLPVGLDGRLHAYAACLQALPQAGLLGLGPGTFEITFPFFTSEWGAQLGGVTRNPRSDALQCLLEWGPIGAALWLTLLALPLLQGAAIFNRRPTNLIPTSDRWPVALALAGVLLHALIDAPFQVPAIALIAFVLAGQLWISPPASSR